MTRRSRTNAQQHDPTFFVDENLCGNFTARLRIAGFRIEELPAHLPKGTPDVDWLPFVANHGWVAITLDQLREDPEEQLALMIHGVKVFVLVGKATNEQRANMIVRKRRWICRTVEAYPAPFLARISMETGGHTLTSFADFMNKLARRHR